MSDLLRSTLRLAPLLLLGLGCATPADNDDDDDGGSSSAAPIEDADDFVQAFATTMCGWYEDCDLMDQTPWTDVDECIDTLLDMMAILTADPDCVYDPQVAGDCIAAIEGSSCAAPDQQGIEGCEQVCGPELAGG